jgi:hypothetical protein
MGDPQWNFIFFRSAPDPPGTRAALTSAMQSTDTLLLLIGLKRYPNAVSMCATVIESVIKSSRAGLSLERDGGLRKLIKLARRESVELASFPERSLDEFRETRNL